MKGGYAVYRPMLCLNQDEIQIVCEEKSLPVLEIPCKYSLNRPKKMLGNYFQHFGYRFEYADILSFANEYIQIADLEEIQNISQEEYLTRRF